MAETMKAGRELDAMIAERVMGWTVVHYNEGAERVVGYSDDSALYYENADGSDPDGVKRSSLGGDWSYWSPSREIADAWLVVEKMCPTANRAEPWFQLYTTSGKWVANFHHYTPDVFAETAQLAICLAALAAAASGHSGEEANG